MNDMRYLASVVTTCFSSFGELLALHKRFAELSGGIVRSDARKTPDHTDASQNTSEHQTRQDLPA